MLNKPSLKSLLCLHSVCGILLTAILLSIVTGFALRNLTEQRILESNTAYARKLANTADNMFRTAQKELAFSAGQITSYRDLQALQYETDRLRLQSDMFSSVLALSPEGRIVAASPLNLLPSGTSLSVAPWQLQAVKKGPFVSDPVTPYTGNYLVFLSNPVHSPSGEYLGYLAGSIYLTKSSMLSRLLNQHFYADKTTVSIVSDTGEVVHSPDKTLTGKKINLSADLSAQMKEKKYGAVKTLLNQQECLLGYSDVVKTNWHVFVCVSSDVTTAILNRIVRDVILYGLVLALLLVIASLYISARISQPLENLTRLTSSGTAGRLSGKVDEIKTWYREADRLKKAFQAYSRTINKTFSVLRDDALTDHLTKLHNRRGFDQLTAPFVGGQGSHSLALIDIDHFKQVNDQFGHDTGDEVLVAVSGLLKEGCRTQDIICRFGGEEFVILFPDTTLTEAGRVVNRIRENIANVQFPTVKHITISAGVCELAQDGDNREKALAVADQLLYRAKHEGRNRVVTPVHSVHLP
ncbi:sensor domain-containing diguanylate cyclase [Erwinia piriflorinigrans]|uniref:diguanylate cyclase n=1 Tax=Erwinia piriflorinigrans CFBP 5888 TaxID=1161919 RepID=V5Z392_9GAMM|nr:sensor domain-containing diguanylate cyclase [Erwinia piriflorinigrans]CCG85775.1 putative signaling protein [Erwinia piriflorinigrans CFBP 5888]